MRKFIPEEKELIVNTPITADILGFKELTPPANKIVEALEVLRFIAKNALDTDEYKHIYFDEFVSLLPNSYKVVKL